VLRTRLLEASPNRRHSFLKKLGVATAAVGAIALTVATPAEAQTMTEETVLNFALNLEYLESEFYSFAMYGSSATNFGIGIGGVATGSNPSCGGDTTGGKKVTFSNNLVFTQGDRRANRSDERAHIVLLRSALGKLACRFANYLDFGSHLVKQVRELATASARAEIMRSA
jgi:hypothetical protein